MPCRHIYKIREMIRGPAFYYDAFASDVWEQLNICNCESEESVERLRNRIRELENKVSSLESSSSNQLVLRRSTENSLSIIRQERDGLKEQITTQNRVIKWGEEELGRKIIEIGQLKTERDDFKNEVRRITDLFNALQLENTRKNEETNRLKNEIKNLKGELGQSKEEFLKQKISLKEGKLETFIQQLGANRGKIMNDLLNAYKQLLKARSDFNQGNIDAADNSINDIKQELLANGIIYRGISVNDTQKVCSKCEKLAKLKLELNQIYQQQFQAQQEQPTNN